MEVKGDSTFEDGNFEYVHVVAKMLGGKRKEPGECREANKCHKGLKTVQTTAFCRLVKPKKREGPFKVQTPVTHHKPKLNWNLSVLILFQIQLI